MVNPFDMVKKAKKKASAYREDVMQRKAIKTAGELKELKRRRVAAEGRAKIYDIRNKERKKLEAAESKVRGRSLGAKVAKKLAQNYKENRKKSGGLFGGDDKKGGAWTVPGADLDIGAPGSPIGTSPLLRKKEKPKQKKKGGTKITIKLD